MANWLAASTYSQTAFDALACNLEQRILLCLHDSINFPVAFLGAIQAGVVPVPVNTLLTSAEYEYMLADSRACLAIVSAPLAPLFIHLVDKLSSLRQIIVSGEDLDNTVSMRQFFAQASARGEVAATTRDDICFWLYSSGSTGHPKGMVHVHSSLMYTADYYARSILGIVESEVVFSAAKHFCLWPRKRTHVPNVGRSYLSADG